MQILYGTDGSEGSLAAAGFLNGLKLTADDEIVVLTVISKRNEAKGRKRLKQTCAALRANRARIARKVSSGAAAEVILKTAKELKPDLVVLGSRGLKGVTRFLLGSVAERVVCHATCPVLVARTLVGKLNRVVVGLDFSDTALRSAQFVLRDLPLPARCETLIATMQPVLQAMGTSAGRVPSLAAELQALQAREGQEARARLEEVAATFEESRLPVSTEYRERHPAAGLLEIAEERRADLIVIGRQGLSRIERFGMGSVSMNVLRHAECSVLVVPELTGGESPSNRG